MYEETVPLSHAEYSCIVLSDRNANHVLLFVSMGQSTVVRSPSISQLLLVQPVSQPVRLLLLGMQQQSC